MILAREYFNDATTATKPISIKVSNVDGYDAMRVTLRPNSID